MNDTFWRDFFSQVDYSPVEDEVDSDGDGIPDDEDPYPNDPNNGEGDEDEDYQGIDLSKIFGDPGRTPRSGSSAFSLDGEDDDPNTLGNRGKTVKDFYNARPDNRFRDAPARRANDPNVMAARAADAAQDAEDRIRSRPRAERQGPVPLNRLPKSAFSEGNPHAGVDDSMARQWERTSGSLRDPDRRGGGGGLAALAAKLGYTPNGADLPTDFRERLKENLSGRFTQTPVAKSANEAFRTAKGFGDVSDLESKYYLPFFDNELGGKGRAVGNTLRSLGFNPDSGNPYVNFLGSHGGRLADQALVSRALKGESPDERTIASDLSGAMAAGKSNIFTPETLRAELSALKGRDDLLPSQAALIAHLETDPDFATGLVEDFISPDLRQGYKRSERKRMERFVNRAPEQTDMGMLDFILQGLR